MDAFTDVEVNLSGEAARSVGPAAVDLVANGHAAEVSPGYCRSHLRYVLHQGHFMHLPQRWASNIKALPTAARAVDAKGAAGVADHG